MAGGIFEGRHQVTYLPTVVFAHENWLDPVVDAQGFFAFFFFFSSLIITVIT